MERGGPGRRQDALVPLRPAFAGKDATGEGDWTDRSVSLFFDVLEQSYGNRYNKDCFRDVFRKIAREAQLDLENRDLTPYSIRHSTATYVAEPSVFR